VVLDRLRPGPAIVTQTSSLSGMFQRPAPRAATRQ